MARNYTIQLSNLRHQLTAPDAPKKLLSFGPYVAARDFSNEDLAKIKKMEQDSRIPLDWRVQSQHSYFNRLQLGQVLRPRQIQAGILPFKLTLGSCVEEYAILLPVTIIPFNTDDSDGFVHIYYGCFDNGIKAVPFFNQPPRKTRLHMSEKYKSKCNICRCNAANVYFGCNHGGMCVVCAFLQGCCPICQVKDTFVCRISLHQDDDISESRFVNQPCGHVSKNFRACIRCTTPIMQSDEIVLFYD